MPGTNYCIKLGLVPDCQTRCNHSLQLHVTSFITAGINVVCGNTQCSKISKTVRKKKPSLNTNVEPQIGNSRGDFTLRTQSFALLKADLCLNIS